MEPSGERSWLGRNWKWLLPVGCLLPFVAVGGCVTLIIVGVFGALKASDAYHLSLAAVRADQAVVDALGEPIEPAFLVSGNIHVSTQGGNADVHYDITGPKATGTVHAVAVKEAGSWKFRSLVVETSTGEKIDVLDHQHSAELTKEAI
jgi:hypothetical protein